MSFMSGWVKRWIAPIDHLKVGSGGVSNFPAYLSGAVIPAEVLSACAYEDCRDLRVTLDDGTTMLNLENVLFSRSGLTGEGHFNHPSISSATDTVPIFYAGNPDVGKMTTAEQQAVWVNDAGVWHLNETGAGSVGDYKDSTANVNHSTNTTRQPTVTASGKIGNAQAFGGSHIVSAGSTGFSATAGTLSGWCLYNNYASAGYQNAIAAPADAPNRVYINKYAGGDMRFQHFGGNIGVLVSVDVSSYSGWHHWALTWNKTANQLKAYIDGVQVGTTQAGLGTFTGTPVVGIGADAFGNYLSGTADEMRMSSVARTAADILTSYNNQFSPATFYKAGTVESKPGGRVFAVTSGGRMYPGGFFTGGGLN